MRIIAPHGAFVRRTRVNDALLSPCARKRLDVIKAVADLVAAGCRKDAAIASQGVKRRTYYRWQAQHRRRGPNALEPKSTAPKQKRKREWTLRDVQSVMAVRSKYPFMGCRSIHAVLRRDGTHLSRAAVGRIVRLCLKRRWIKPVVWLRGRAKPKRRRDFSDSYAERWRCGMRAKAPGELVQVDHMTVNRDGRTLKEFRAVDPVSRVMVCRVFSRATAGNAKRFLADVVRDMPFPVRSVQVDGGSEFMADFEAQCARLGLPLFVLPPRRPQWNGRVERCNDTLRLEFWSLWKGGLTVAEVAPALARHQRWHNVERPHSALDYLSPMEHLVKLQNLQMAA